MESFTVARDVTGELHDAVLGRIAFEFAAGTHEPASEQQERVLGWLTEVGLAEPATEAKPSAPKRKGRRGGDVSNGEPADGPEAQDK